jgi:hypothetical protein
MESNRTFKRTCPFCHAVIPQARVEHSNGGPSDSELYRRRADEKPTRTEKDRTSAWNGMKFLLNAAQSAGGACANYILGLHVLGPLSSERWLV